MRHQTIAFLVRAGALICLLGGISYGVSLTAQQGGGVTSQQLLDGMKDPTRWVMFSGDYSGQRHSPLTQITPQNVKQLRQVWQFQTGQNQQIKATPILVNGVMYI